MAANRKRAKTQPPLPRDIVEDLLAAVAPMSPPTARASALRDRLLTRVRRDAQRFVTVRATDGSWVPLAPRIAVKMLDDDGAMQAFLLRLDPGARMPAHDHPVEELCLVLEGSVRLGDIEVSSGDLHLAGPGSAHGEIYSPSGALLFIRTKSGTIPRQPAA